MVIKLKAEILEKAGIAEEHAKFEPTDVMTQVVAGTNFFVKIEIDGDQSVHARIFRGFGGDVELANAKQCNDAIAFFE